MKKKKIALRKMLVLSKETITALQQEQSHKVMGGASEKNCQATQERECRTLGLAIDLTKCCQVYELSVNLPCNG